MKKETIKTLLKCICEVPPEHKDSKELYVQTIWVKKTSKGDIICHIQVIKSATLPKKARYLIKSVEVISIEEIVSKINFTIKKEEKCFLLGENQSDFDKLIEVAEVLKDKNSFHLTVGHGTVHTQGKLQTSRASL